MTSKRTTGESGVERYLHRRVVACGGWTDKFKSPGRRNVPDRIVTWPARAGEAKVHFIECKAPGKRARPGQQRDHARRRAMGCTVNVLDTKAKVDVYVWTVRGG